jgi:chromosome segregation ATPase
MSKLNEEMKKLGEELKEMGPKLEKEMQKAKEEIEKAKAEIKEYKTFVDGLENDGLISKKDGYTLKHKDGELLINGKKADASTYSKYRSFLDKHPKFSINKSDDDFDMDMD